VWPARGTGPDNRRPIVAEEVALARDISGPSASPSPGEHPYAAGQHGAGPAEASQPPVAVAALPAEAAAGPPPAAAAAGPRPSPGPGRPRKLLFVTLPGCWGALIFACLSFTPSLLPRGGVVQGLVWGITAAIGYGLGVLAAWVWRAFADRDPRRPRRWAWLTFFITGGVLLAVAFGLGQYWQYEIRKLMGVTDYNIPLVVASPVPAVMPRAPCSPLLSRWNRLAGAG
jgi:MFS family permease